MHASRLSRTVVTILLWAAALYVLLCVALLVFQRSIIYFPQPRAIDNPNTLLKLPIENAEVLVSTRPLKGRNALIYFGGNGEDVTLNLPEFSQAFSDHALYLLHYRGYGGSSGSPSEEAIQGDALTFFDQVYAQHPCTVVVGRSLGSGVAVRLASQRPAAHLVLITPYNSIQELAQSRFPYIPVQWLLKDKFESWKYAQQIRVPTLLISAEQDQVIPRASTDALFSHFATGVAALKGRLQELSATRLLN
ncbi:alpha/beta hydrolase [Pseudomonas sp.]|uniref:alpha/beta hydrolase n=1 Tax=Pseudomonas sp. TaxID=306 RepID=UPI004053844B